METKDRTLLLIGTYTQSCDSSGIYVYEFDRTNGVAKKIGHSDPIVNPSYLTVSDDADFVYAVNEDGKNSNVSALNLDRQTAKLYLLNDRGPEGQDPCYLINDHKNVIVANYGSGSISVFEKKKDGTLKRPKQVLKHHGKGLDTKPQEASHVHMVHFSPDRRYVFAVDLGTDQIYIYHYYPDSENEPLIYKSSISVRAGSGPRHLTFSPDGRFAYLVHELDGTVTAFGYDDGKLKQIQQTTLIGSAAPKKISGGAIKVSADGRFLYVTNREDANTITVFAIGDEGNLTHVQTTSSRGKGPRDLTLDPTGKYVLVAHENSNEVVIYERDLNTGEVTYSGNKIKLCMPVCLVFVE
ncbi:MAG TPA: lactonase family protein [Flavobacterium sp.]|jgi:6-phosphogluconolactonase